MSITLQLGTTGPELNWSNANFQWVMRSLSIHYTPETEAFLPSDILTRIQTFFNRTSGYYTDPDLVARIYEYLAQSHDPGTEAFIAQLTEIGVEVVDCSNIDYSNLGSIRDPNSAATHLWETLSRHISELRRLARAAQAQNEIIRVY